MNIWRVEILGDARDLEYLSEVLGTGERMVLRDERSSGYVYESKSFEPCSRPDEVERIARDEVAILSGILKFERGARDALECGCVCRKNANGGLEVFVHVRESLSARDITDAIVATVTDAAGNVVTESSPPLSRSLILLRLAVTDGAVAKVLRLSSADDASTWVGLYRIHEVIENDVGGQRKISAQGWGSANDLNRFRHSANSVQVGGDESRHGKEQQAAPKNPMTLSEAHAYVNYVVQAWIASKLV
jgi:hypothetical protein